MVDNSLENPLPPCPITPNCSRTSAVFESGVEKVFGALREIVEAEAHSFEVIDPKRITLHAVYRIPIFGFKDDVDIILEESGENTTLHIRSASRLGAFDLFVNKMRVNRILRKLESKIRP